MPNITFELNKVYTFNTLAPALLGTQVKNAKLTGIVDYTTALAYDNIDLKFRQIYPNLPNGTVNDPKSCIYYRFESQSKENIILADQWIDMTTLEVINHINFQITMTGGTVADMSRIRDALNSLGYQNYVIKQI